MKGKVLRMSPPRRAADSGAAAAPHSPLRERENAVHPEARKIARLTKREREVVTLVGEGLKNAEIARRLFISTATVRHHLSSVFTKLDVPDRLKLIVYAYRHGLVEIPDEK